MSLMIQWCETPRPRVKRPVQTAWLESVCCARTTGCRGWTGTIEVPTSIRDVAAPISVTAVMTSISSGICGVHTVSSPASSAHRASAWSFSTLVA